MDSRAKLESLRCGDAGRPSLSLQYVEHVWMLSGKQVFLHQSSEGGTAERHDTPQGIGMAAIRVEISRI